MNLICLVNDSTLLRIAAVLSSQRYICSIIYLRLSQLYHCINIVSTPLLTATAILPYLPSPSSPYLPLSLPNHSFLSSLINPNNIALSILPAPSLGAIHGLQFNPHKESSHLLASGGADGEVYVMSLEKPDMPNVSTHSGRIRIMKTSG